MNGDTRLELAGFDRRTVRLEQGQVLLRLSDPGQDKIELVSRRPQAGRRRHGIRGRSRRTGYPGGRQRGCSRCRSRRRRPEAGAGATA